MRILLLTLIIMLAMPAMAQTVYRWVDGEGNVHYGERPPPGVDAEPVRMQRPPSQEAVETAEAFAEADLDAEEEQRLALQRRSCELAREAVRAYSRSDFLYETDNETGERRILEDEEAEQVRADARREVEERCAGLEEE